MPETLLSTRNGELGELLARLDSWLYLEVDRRTDPMILRVHGAVVATLDPASRALLVNVPRSPVAVRSGAGEDTRVPADPLALDPLSPIAARLSQPARLSGPR
jgi:hypothetical protein